MWTRLHAVWYLRTRLLRNNLRENPRNVLPGIGLLALTTLAHIADTFNLIPNGFSVEPSLLKANDGLISVSITVFFSIWLMVGLITGLRHGTMQKMGKLVMFPVSGVEILAAQRLTAVLDPWVILILPGFPLLFSLFGVTVLTPGFPVALLACGCLLHLCIGLATVMETLAARLMDSALVRGVVGLLLIGALVLPYSLDLKQMLRSEWGSIEAIVYLLPTGALTQVFLRLSEGSSIAALQATLPLIAFAIGVTLLEAKVTLRVLSDGMFLDSQQRPKAANLFKRVERTLSNLLPGDLKRVTPFVTKDILAFIRHPRLWMVPVSMAVVAFYSSNGLELNLFETTLFISGYGVILCGAVLVNWFGLDCMGGISYLMVPLTNREIVQSKQITHWAVLLVQFLAIALLLRLYLPDQFSPLRFYALLIFNLYLAIVAAAVGGLLSLLFPHVTPMRTVFGQTGPPATSFIGFTVAMLLAIAPAVVLERMIHDDMVLLAGFISLLLTGFVVYRFLSTLCVRLMKNRREAFLITLTVKESSV